MRISLPPLLERMALVSGLLCAPSLSLAAQSLDWLQEYSVITSGDFTSTSSVHGKILVGGDLAGSNSMDLAVRLSGLVSPSVSTVQVGGSIQSGNPINLQAGSIEYGGSLNRAVNYNGGGSAIHNPGADYSSIFVELGLTSQALAARPANQSLLLPSGQAAGVNFQPVFDASNEAIYHVSGADLFSNRLVQQIDLNLQGGTGSILINVSGTNLNFNQGNFVGGFNQNSAMERIIWNFYEAETLNFDRAFSGQILAPNALITTNQVINGSVFAREINTRAGIQFPTYRGGDFGVTVPEPSSVIFMSFSLMALLRRRR